MRALSVKQADRCETAEGHTCRCRCGGKFHGSRRGEGVGFFNALPADDPHYIASPAAKRAAKREQQQLAKKGGIQLPLKM